MKRNWMLVAAVAVVFSFVSFQPAVFAEGKEGKSKLNPMGWLKGEKKGWKEGDVPPGLSNKEAKKAEKEARKKAKQAEKEARKNAKKAEKEAGKKAEDVQAAVS